MTDDGEYESVQMPCGCILSLVHIFNQGVDPHSAFSINMYGHAVF